MKGTAPETLDLGRAPKPAVSHCRPPATGPFVLVHQIVAAGSVPLPILNDPI